MENINIIKTKTVRPLILYKITKEIHAFEEIMHLRITVWAEREYAYLGPRL